MITKRLFVALIMTCALGCQLFGQQQQIQTTTAQVEAQRTLLPTQNGNATVDFIINQGITAHQFTIIAAPSVTGLTTTITMGSTSGFATCGTSTMTIVTITCSGTYTQARVAFTGYVGSGGVNAVYLGASSLGASGSVSVDISTISTQVTNIDNTTSNIDTTLTTMNSTLSTLNNTTSNINTRSGDIYTTVQAAASGGLPTTTRAVSGTVLAVSAVSGSVLVGCQCTNSHTTNYSYAQIFNLPAAAVSLGSTVPAWVLGLPPNGGSLCPAPAVFSNAISIAITTTTGGSAGINPSGTCSWSLR